MKCYTKEVNGVKFSRGYESLADSLSCCLEATRISGKALTKAFMTAFVAKYRDCNDEELQKIVESYQDGKLDGHELAIAPWYWVYPKLGKEERCRFDDEKKDFIDELSDACDVCLGFSGITSKALSEEFVCAFEYEHKHDSEAELKIVKKRYIENTLDGSELPIDERFWMSPDTGFLGISSVRKMKRKKLVESSI